jgi:hypothetical protein
MFGWARVIRTGWHCNLVSMLMCHHSPRTPMFTCLPCALMACTAQPSIPRRERPVLGRELQEAARGRSGGASGRGSGQPAAGRTGQQHDILHPGHQGLRLAHRRQRPPSGGWRRRRLRQEAPAEASRAGAASSRIHRSFATSFEHACSHPSATQGRRCRRRPAAQQLAVGERPQQSSDDDRRVRGRAGRASRAVR